MLQQHRIGWNVERDIGALASAGVYAYDLAARERVADGEFELDETSRGPRGVWSGEVTPLPVARLTSRSLPGARLPRASGRG